MPLPKVVSDVLRSAAPTVLTALALPPPFNILASAVVSGVLAHYLPAGQEPAQQQPNGATALSPQQVEQVVAANAGNPAFIYDLRKAELELQKYEMEAGIRFAELESKERERAGSFQRDTGIAIRTFRAGMLLVALAMTGMLVVVVGALALVFGGIRIPAGSSDVAIASFGLVGTVVGFINGIAGTVISFYWGSSKASDEKNDVLAATMRDMGEQLGKAAITAPIPRPQPPVVVVPPAPEPTPQPPPMPQESRFTAIIGDLLRDEGGYVNDPDDPGGCTNLGITLATLRAWRGDQTTTCEDVRHLTEQEARQIYMSRYWNALQCDRLPPGLDYIVFDFGVNAGTSRAAKTLQTCLQKRDASLAVDGVIGPLTLAAVAKAQPHALIDEFHAARMAFYRSLPHWSKYGEGWTNRAERVLAKAKAAAGSR